MVNRVIRADVNIEAVNEVGEGPSEQDVLEIIGVGDHLEMHATSRN